VSAAAAAAFVLIARVVVSAAAAAASAFAAAASAAQVTNEFLSHFSVEQTVFSSGLSKNQSRLSGQELAVGHVGVVRPHAGQSRHFGLSFPVQKHPALLLSDRQSVGAGPGAGKEKFSFPAAAAASAVVQAAVVLPRRRGDLPLFHQLSRSVPKEL
jgi:hypothetical protein